MGILFRLTVMNMGTRETLNSYHGSLFLRSLCTYV